jgi:urease accessory protein
MHMNDWTIWQLVDSAFPAGGFAHSAGLEAAWQAGAIGDASALRQFARDSIGQAGRAGLPFVTAAHAEPDRIAELDALCDAFLSTAVANRASRAQGRAFLVACASTWPSEALRELERRTLPAGHLAPVLGAATAAIGCPRAAAQKVFLQLAVRGVIAAAVRLGIVGPYEAQRMQADCADDLDRTLERCSALTEVDAAQTAPLLDVLQGTHDRLYSRLFQS